MPINSQKRGPWEQTLNVSPESESESESSIMMVAGAVLRDGGRAEAARPPTFLAAGAGWSGTLSSSSSSMSMPAPSNVFELSPPDSSSESATILLLFALALLGAAFAFELLLPAVDFLTPEPAFFPPPKLSLVWPFAAPAKLKVSASSSSSPSACCDRFRASPLRSL